MFKYVVAIAVKYMQWSKMHIMITQMKPSCSIQQHRMEILVIVQVSLLYLFLQLQIYLNNKKLTSIISSPNTDLPFIENKVISVQKKSVLRQIMKIL